MLIDEILQEMSGVLTKSAGDTVLLNMGSGKLGRVLFLTDDSILLPPPEQGEFSGPRERQQALDRVDRLGVVWVNPAARTGARAVAVRKFVNELGGIVYVGKYLSSSSAALRGGHDATDARSDRWDLNSLERLGYVNRHKNRLIKLGLEHLAQAYQQASRENDWKIYDRVLKSRGLDTPNPVTLLPVGVLSQLNNLDARAVLSQIRARFAKTNPDLVEIAEVIARGQSGPWPMPQSVGASQFTKEFCEILQPLAVVSGAFPLAAFPDIKSGLISFNAGKSAQFIDSQISMGNTDILISSKQGTGTTSSIGGLQPHIETWIQQASPAQRKRYARELQVLDIIVRSPIKPRPGNIGVLAVPVLYGIISEKDARDISRMDANDPGYYKRTGRPNPIPRGISAELKNIIKASPQSPKHGPSPYYQSLNWVMKQAGQAVNSDPKMNELLKQIFDTINYVLIATVANKDKFMFEQRQENIAFTLGESYNSYEAKKRLAFKVY